MPTIKSAIMNMATESGYEGDTPATIKGAILAYAEAEEKTIDADTIGGALAALGETEDDGDGQPTT